MSHSDYSHLGTTRLWVHKVKTTEGAVTVSDLQVTTTPPPLGKTYTVLIKALQVNLISLPNAQMRMLGEFRFLQDFSHMNPALNNKMLKGDWL